MSALLEVAGLQKYFRTRKLIGPSPLPVRAVEEVSFSVREGESFALVGESGCGKSTVARCIVGLLEPDSGSVRINGEDLVQLRRRDLRAACRAAQMVFQDPYSSLNPRLSIGDALAEPFIIHGTLKRADIRAKVESLLQEVGLERTAARRYPHEFSGGQRQRIGIARALALEPAVLIADEPVSALDVSIQSQILLLLRSLQKSRNLSLVFITHDLAVVRNFCDHVGVMYLGSLVEQGRVEDVMGAPVHPYTVALRDAALPPEVGARESLTRIEGEMPSAVNPPSGCRFHPRCPRRLAHCSSIDPAWTELDGTRSVRCHLVQPVAPGQGGNDDGIQTSFPGVRRP